MYGLEAPFLLLPKPFYLSKSIPLFCLTGCDRKQVTAQTIIDFVSNVCPLEEMKRRVVTEKKEKIDQYMRMIDDILLNQEP